MRRLIATVGLGAAILLGGAALLLQTDLGAWVRAEYRVVGLTLESTTRPEAEGWAVENGGTCVGGQRTLRCSDVLDMKTVIFGFNAEQLLVSIDLAHAPPDAEATAEMLAQKAEVLERRLGKPRTQRGEGTAAYLGSGAMRTATLSYRIKEVGVELTAMNIGMGRFLVREHHQAM